ncbi:putative clathrin assembly protein, partial [Cucurbita argyrosperma subsp. sororia]
MYGGSTLPFRRLFRFIIFHSLNHCFQLAFKLQRLKNVVFAYSRPLTDRILIVQESFQLYSDIYEVLALLHDKFFGMEHPDCVKAFDAYDIAGKPIDELSVFYNWCKDVGVVRSSEYLEVRRIDCKKTDAVSSDDQGHSRLALALFAGLAANGTNESWEAFPSSNRQPEVTHGTADACC